MTRLATTFLGALFLVSTGCGGGSGVDRSKTAEQLDASEKMAFCEWMVDELGGPREQECSADEDDTAEVPTVADCVASLPGKCTVGVMEDCTKAMKGDPCRILEEEKCGPMVQCILESFFGEEEE
jgi:hypothetical protein